MQHIIGPCCGTFGLVAEIGFIVGCLFPARYWCESLACAKITHNCVMTLASLPFTFLELALGKQLLMQATMYEESRRCKTLARTAKVCCVILDFAYILYDMEIQAQEAPGSGTTVLIVLACTGDALLLLIETCMEWLHFKGEL